MSTQLLKKLQKELSLEDVYFKAVNALVQEDFDPKYTTTKYGIQLKYIPSSESHAIDISTANDPPTKKRVVRFFIDAGVRLVDVTSVEDETEKPIRVEITATVVVEYTAVHLERKFSAEELAAFVENACWHAWPYWRELVQSAAHRLRLPQELVLPMRGFNGPASSRGASTAKAEVSPAD